MLASLPPVVGVLSKGSRSPSSRHLFCSAGSMGRRRERSAPGYRAAKVCVVDHMGIVYRSQVIKAVLAAAVETSP
jgi:hypothetical protein